MVEGSCPGRSDLEPGDFRLQNPRFTDEAIAKNSRLADGVAGVAREIGATTARVALAWILSRDVPLAAIPGTRKIERLEENWASPEITLRPDHAERLGSLLDQGVVGSRY